MCIGSLPLTENLCPTTRVGWQPPHSLGFHPKASAVGIRRSRLGGRPKRRKSPELAFSQRQCLHGCSFCSFLLYSSLSLCCLWGVKYTMQYCIKEVVSRLCCLVSEQMFVELKTPNKMRKYLRGKTREQVILAS